MADPTLPIISESGGNGNLITTKDNDNKNDNSDNNNKQPKGPYTPIEFPFFAAEDDLPAPLPTVAEILTSKDESMPCIFKGRHIRRVKTHFLVKHGAIKLDEAANMHFAAHHGVPVPKLYAAFHDDATDGDYIIMAYVRGQSLESLWDTLAASGRRHVARHLKTALDTLRAIPHEGYYGRLGRRPYDDIFLAGSKHAEPPNSGPFATEDELNAAFHDRFAAVNPRLAPGRGAFYRDRVFPAAMRGHAPVFTHGDLQAKNVLIRAEDGLPVLIDWECAAWYPAYWEYTNALWTSRRWSDGWWCFLGEFLDEWVVEFKCMENLLGDLLLEPAPGAP